MADAHREEDQLYVIGPARGSVVKIGVSNHPGRRLSQLNSSSPVPLVIRWSRPGSYPLEERLHAHLARYRTRGEWFDLRGVDPVPAIQDAIRSLEAGEPGPYLAKGAEEKCTCGHRDGRHDYQAPRRCNVIGWDEWLDCTCQSYTPSQRPSVLTSVPAPATEGGI